MTRSPKRQNTVSVAVSPFLTLAFGGGLRNGARKSGWQAARAARAAGLPQRVQIIRGQVPHERPMGVALDRGMIHVRNEGWKEPKVSTVFAIEPRLERDPVTQALEWQAHALENSYIAVLGRPQAFGAWAEAVRREFPRAGDWVALVDEAAWIWNLVGGHLSGSRQVVDWFHTKPHLAGVGAHLFGEGSAKVQRWVKQMETPLYQGHAAEIADMLSQLAKTHRRAAKTLRQEVGYFQTNQRRMQYLETREDGFPIGSGMVESEVKQFPTRFTGPGMQKSRRSGTLVARTGRHPEPAL